MSALFKSLSSYFSSSIGKKILVALTGGALVLFVLGHMIGNLLIYAGPETLNEYAVFLKTAGHGMLLWGARIGLLACVAIHIVLTIKLTAENKAARKDRYGYQQTIKATKSSRFMIVSGLIILAFIVYHIMHFTLHVGNNYGTLHAELDGKQVHDVYTMVVQGFSWLPASIFYIIAMGLLCSHLSHGVSSMFQTLGLATARTWPLFQKVGIAYAALIFIGNCSIPISILMGWVK
jgi:succinate dehydrogenase / fumarate reductase, cytochrome b subunit